MLGVKLGGSLVKPFRVDAAALQLQQESQAGAQQVVQVFDRKRGVRVGIEGRGGAAAQPCHQLLLEQPLAGLIEHSQLARRADEIGELVEEARADAVKGPDPSTIEDLRTKVGPPRRELVRDPPAKLFGGPIAERHREDLVGRDSLFDQPTKPLRGGEGLASARPRSDQECALWTCVRRRGLFAGEGGCADSDGTHSGGAPPYGHTEA